MCVYVCVCLFLSHFRLHVLPSFHTHLRKKARAETNSIVKKKEKEKKEKKKVHRHTLHIHHPHTHTEKSKSKSKAKAKGTRGGKESIQNSQKNPKPPLPAFRIDELILSTSLPSALVLVLVMTLQQPTYLPTYLPHSLPRLDEPTSIHPTRMNTSHPIKQDRRPTALCVRLPSPLIF